MIKKVVEQYAKSYQKLNKNNVAELISYVSDSIEFEDPFNKIRGKEKLEKLFKKMFDILDKPKFVINEIFYKKNKSIIKWHFKFHYRGTSHEFDGISEIVVNKGKIVRHIDFWDTGFNFYCKLPFFGRIFRLIHRKN